MLPIIIAGSRTLKVADYDFVKKICFDIISKEQYEREVPNKELVIVSGKAQGADYLGERFAREYALTIKEFPAQWNDMTPPVVKGTSYYGEYNKLAGAKRNLQMAQYAKESRQGILIAFDAQEGKSSSGTKDMIKIARKNWLKVYHVKCEDRDNVKIKIYNTLESVEDSLLSK
jgi:hypothetical protein